MALEVLTIAGTFVLAIVPFYITLVTLDIIEHILMLMKKLGRVLPEEIHELIELRFASQQWMLI